MQERFYKDFERDFYTEIIVTIVSTNLVTNSMLCLFCSLIENKKQNQIFSKLVLR